jgi:hypothetical protein
VNTASMPRTRRGVVQQPCSSAEALGLKQWTLERREEGDEVIVRHGNRDKYRLVL